LGEKKTLSPKGRKNKLFRGPELAVFRIGGSEGRILGLVPKNEEEGDLV